MGIYVNNQLTYTVNGSRLDTSLPFDPGTYQTVVEEWDYCGGATYTPIPIQVNVAAAGVVVTSPTSGGTYGSSVPYAATAQSACPSGIAAMGIYVNNQLSYVTYSSSLNTSLALNPGSYSTVVQDWDNCGGSSFTPVSINVVAQQAGVNVTSPAANSTVSSPVTYTASASSPTCSSGIAAMGIYVNNQLSYVTYSSSLNTSLVLNPGSYSTVVQEWDNCGGSSFTPVSINVGSQQAGVNVTSPVANTTVSSPVTYTASASSPTCSSGVAAMGIYVNNVLTYVTYATTLNTQIALGQGPQHTVVEEWDNCGGAQFATVDLNVSTVSTGKSIISIALSPNPATATMGSTTQFKATATYSDNSTADITSTATWTVANTAVASINGSGLALANAAGSTSVTATLNGTSGKVPFTATIPAGSAVNIPTWHVDSNRSGLNAGEIALGSSNVSPGTFGKLFSYRVDGYVYGEPLLMSNVTINGGTHNVVYVATEHDSVYAFDSDNYGTGAPLWKVSLLNPGESPVVTNVIQPFQGVTSTPVIDPATNTIYVVSEQMASNGSSSFRLNALDITTGAQKLGGPVTISASVPGSNADAVNGVVSLTTSCTQRAALLLANNSIYIGFGNCHSGWLLAYNAQTLAQTGVFNASPNLNGEGKYGGAGGVWMSGGGPVADSAGNIYIVTGNGPWDGQTSFSDSVLKFNATLQLEDYFTPADYQFMNCDDADLAAGGLMLIPGTTEVIAGGKMGEMHVLNTNRLGGEQAGNAGALQTLLFEGDISAPYASTCTDSTGTHTAYISSYEIFGTSAYFNGSVYLGVEPTSPNISSGIRQFTLSGGMLGPGAISSPGLQLYTPGITPFISANGTSQGILWMIDPGQPLQNGGKNPPTSAVLRAYDATNLSSELYDSNVNSGDIPGYGIKFTSPVVGNGKVYISTGHDLTTVANPQGEIDVYGLK
jgi:hypothetical protein